MAQAQAPAATVYDIGLSGGRLSGNGLAIPARGAPTLRVNQGETIELRWSVDTPTALHLHGYNIEANASPAEMATIRFPARATGRFPVETHDSRGRHRTLLYVEVHPR